jgi:hypothetical protein
MVEQIHLNPNIQRGPAPPLLTAKYPWAFWLNLTKFWVKLLKFILLKKMKYKLIVTLPRKMSEFAH